MDPLSKWVRRSNGMKGKAVKGLIGVCIFLVYSSGVIISGTAGSEGSSKLTIGYMADEIGRLEPCG